MQTNICDVLIYYCIVGDFMIIVEKYCIYTRNNQSPMLASRPSAKPATVPKGIIILPLYNIIMVFYLLLYVRKKNAHSCLLERRNLSHRTCKSRNYSKGFLYS